MQSARKVLRAIFLVMPLLFAGNLFAETISDDYTPEVTARVARIAFLSGEAQIRRADSEDWERAVQNLPLVEGDELATSADARVEIQFNSRTYLRLAENSYLKIVTLKDEGIAVSLPEGTLSLRVLEFDKERAFFEIDAPQTTVAVQKTGMYRVDAGNRQTAEVRVAVTDAGEARIYSENSGFTLRAGRSARLFTGGNFAGEWETGDAARFADDFDKWTLDRDAVVAKLLKDAHYDKYYDQDIYGAEDLSEYGEWIYTRSYGYVWRPFRTSVASYADWSPYRYGHWRWIPPYGWTWVNDEPWGWATYHHGRWVWDDGWVWSPYGQRRLRRSWWNPALVVVTWSGNLICWYPLPYEYGYYDYNRHWRRNRRHTTIINNNTTVVVVNPTPTPAPSPVNPNSPNPAPNPANLERAARLKTATMRRLPENSVVGVDASEFGRSTRGFRIAPPQTARAILDKTPDIFETLPILPDKKELNGKISREILIEPARIPDKTEASAKTGATARKTGQPMDEELRKARIYGNRPPVGINPNQGGIEAGTGVNDRKETRGTGAVARPKPETRGTDDEPVRTPPVFIPNKTDDRNETEPVRTRREDKRDENEPVRTRPRGDDRKNDEPVRTRRGDNENQSPPIFAPPPVRNEKPRDDPPPKRDDPPPRREEPRREEPKPQPPPQKSEPKEERPPSKPTFIERKGGKDGR